MYLLCVLYLSVVVTQGRRTHATNFSVTENNQACVSGSCNSPADVILRPLSFTAQNGAGNKCPIIIRWHTHTHTPPMCWNEMTMAGETMNKQSDSLFQHQSKKNSSPKNEHSAFYYLLTVTSFQIYAVTFSKHKKRK